MKKLMIVILVLIPQVAQAGVFGLETVEEARQRHGAERYEKHQKYKQQGGLLPPMNYDEPLGDSAPQGTERPGYNDNSLGQHRDW